MNTDAAGQFDYRTQFNAWFAFSIRTGLHPMVEAFVKDQAYLVHLLSFRKFTDLSRTLVQCEEVGLSKDMQVDVVMGENPPGIRVNAELKMWMIAAMQLTQLFRNDPFTISGKNVPNFEGDAIVRAGYFMSLLALDYLKGLQRDGASVQTVSEMFNDHLTFMQKFSMHAAIVSVRRMLHQGGLVVDYQYVPCMDGSWQDLVTSED